MEIRRKHSSAFRCAVPPVPNRPSKHLQGEQTPLPRHQWWPGRFHQEAVVERRSSSTPTWPSGGANEAIRQPVPETDSGSGREIHFRSCRSFHRLEHPWGSNKGCSGQFLLTALTIWQRNFPLSIAMSGNERLRQAGREGPGHLPGSVRHTRLVVFRYFSQ